MNRFIPSHCVDAKDVFSPLGTGFFPDAPLLRLVHDSTVKAITPKRIKLQSGFIVHLIVEGSFIAIVVRTSRHQPYH